MKVVDNRAYLGALVKSVLAVSNETSTNKKAESVLSVRVRGYLCLYCHF